MSNSFDWEKAFDAGLALYLSLFAISLVMAAGWITNVIWTFRQDTVMNVLLGILGCIVAPIGGLHGIYTWF